MSRTIRFACAASLLAVVGCRENLSVERNQAPVARAELQGYDIMVQPTTPQYLAREIYLVPLEDGVTEMDLVLDASESTDVNDDEIVEYIWISGTEFPDGSPGRYIPPDERLTQEEIDEAHVNGEQLDAWPMDGITTTVTLIEGDWWFHVYARDEHGALSEPATIHLIVGDPLPIGAVPGEDDAGMGDDAGLDDDAGDAGMDIDAGAG